MHTRTRLLPTVFQAAYDSLAVHADLRALPPVHAQLQRLREAMLDVPWDQPLDARCVSRLIGGRKTEQKPDEPAMVGPANAPRTRCTPWWRRFAAPS